ncbi:MAG: Gfo/Idh/MocA family oxidoreductase [Planctomycetota bacterium]|nr:Gfo/Idh/MocA family oxidoreductase [Planctomycetota bacterium]
MGVLDKLNLAIVGVAGRGGSFRSSVAAFPRLRLHAICDLNADGLDKAASDLGVEHKYTNYEEMLDKAKPDAVIIGTPMPLHVPQAIAAIRRGIHAISEVPAGVSVEECRDLVQACKGGKAIYMMAENYTYMEANQIICEMVKRGEFGRTYYAEGEYIHELKGLNEVTKWRRKWQTGVDGITYCTHSLGPVLQWFPGERVVSVSCAGSGHHYKDPRGNHYENQDSCVMLGKTTWGGLVKIRVDMLSDRPHAMTNYQLQGTDGCYESARGGPGDINKIWLRSRAKEPHKWFNLEEIKGDFVPENWVKFRELAQKAGHGGGDLLELLDFVDAIEGTRPTPIGIHEAMDMTLPGLVSQQSIAVGGQWLPVPDSRLW